MTEPVVDRFETVDIDEDQGSLTARSSNASNGAIETRKKPSSIGEVHQSVDVSDRIELCEPSLGFRELGTQPFNFVEKQYGVLETDEARVICWFIVAQAECPCSEGISRL